MREIKRKVLNQFSSARIILFGFIIMIFVGASILSLPISSRSREFTPFIDALFTATSASCVTGLIVYDTATHWSVFGKIIIIAMIQCGGLGVVTMITVFTQVAGKKIGLRDRATLQSALSAPQIGGIVKLTSFIFKGTVIIEMIGAILMFPSFMKDFGVTMGIYYSIFHSISAFCNAGFDNLGSNSLINYATDPLLNLVIAALIILGGIGFSVWFDFKNSYLAMRESTKSKKKKSFYRRLHYHTKVVLWLTGIILLSGTVLTMLTEWNNPNTIGNLSFLDKLLVSFFQTVTMRTAGFASIDYTTAHPTSLLLYSIQMLIGGSPGGTAGGVKTTTFLVVLLFIRSEVYDERMIQFRNHRISQELARKALTIFIVFTTLILTSVFLLSLTDPDAPLLYTLFETISAVCTVGVTANLTPTLSFLGKIVIMLLMFIGRIGPLTVLLSFSNRKKKTLDMKYAKAPLIIG